MIILILLRSNSKWCRGLGRRLGWIEFPKIFIDFMELIQSSINTMSGYITSNGTNEIHQ